MQDTNMDNQISDISGNRMDKREQLHKQCNFNL